MKVSFAAAPRLLWRTLSLLIAALILAVASRRGFEIFQHLRARAARAADRAADRERREPHARRARHGPARPAPRAAASTSREREGIQVYPAEPGERLAAAARRPAGAAARRSARSAASSATETQVAFARDGVRGVLGELPHRRRRVLGDAAARRASSGGIALHWLGWAMLVLRARAGSARFSSSFARQPAAARADARRGRHRARPDRRRRSRGIRAGRDPARWRARSTRWRAICSAWRTSARCCSPACRTTCARRSRACASGSR